MQDQIFGEGRGRRAGQLVLASLLLFGVFLAVKVITDLKKLPNAGREVYPQSTIMVTGSGEAYAVPDVATFNFSVVETGSTVKQAQEKADQKMNKALAAVKEAGVEDKDIKTTSYNVYPKYEYSPVRCVTYPCPAGKQVLTGYEVNQTVTVKVRDTEKAADLVTTVGAAGVSNISGVEFTVDDREAFVAQAREQAIEEAQAKAKVLAGQLGVRLGKVLYYNDNSEPLYYAYGKGGAATDMSASSVAPREAQLPAGENKITSNISITYEIR